MLTRSHWKDYLTDKNMLLSLITYKLTFMVVGFFFFLQTNGFCYKQKKPRSIKVLKGEYMTVLVTDMLTVSIYLKKKVGIIKQALSAFRYISLVAMLNKIDPARC